MAETARAISAAPGAAPFAPKPSEANARGALDMLLRIEADTRRAQTPKELSFLIANETLKITRSRQIFLSLPRGRQRARIEAVSSLSHVDRNAPRIRWIEGIIDALGKDAGLDDIREFTLPAYTPKGDEEHKNFPFRSMLWVPLKLSDGYSFAGILLAREIPWTEGDQVVSKRLSETFAHAWSALEGPRKLKRRFRPGPWIAAACGILAIAAGAYPVPLTVLAPLEIAAVASKVVAAPLDGIVDAVVVKPNEAVAAGQVVARMSDTALRNDLSIAEQEVKVAEARLKLSMQGAVNDPKLRRELAISRADVSLKKARLDFARDMLARSAITAPAAGIAVYADERDWMGRPVQTGERILEIADPAALELKIEVPVQDSIAIKPGAKVRAFIDSDPLHPVDAVVRSASYEARPIAGGRLAYQVNATLAAGSGEGLRLGIRGTAQIAGAEVPLAFWLFRKPLTTVRQWLGL
jgi:HlyD family secretion protein/Biotin-lipoyl like